MPKLLTQSKHEEFESNSSLQIRSQRERRAKSEENGALRNLHPAALFTSPATVHPAARSCFLRCALFAFVFGFFPIYPCNSLPIFFFFFFL